MRFLCDVDDVLTPFVARLLPYLQEIKPDFRLEDLDPDVWDLFSTLTHRQRTMIFAVMAREGFCRSFQSAEGAYEAVTRLRSLGCHVYAVTAPNHFPYWASERVKWLWDKFAIDSDEVALTNAKHIVKGDFMLDDRPEHVVRWAKENPQGVAMLWTTEHNCRSKTGLKYRVRGWDEVLNIVKNASAHYVHMGDCDGTVPLCVSSPTPTQLNGRFVFPTPKVPGIVVGPHEKFPENWEWCPDCVAQRGNITRSPGDSLSPVYKLNPEWVRNRFNFEGTP